MSVNQSIFNFLKFVSTYGQRSRQFQTVISSRVINIFGIFYFEISFNQRILSELILLEKDIIYCDIFAGNFLIIYPLTFDNN